MENNHTFIICCYKESPYLEACIQSLQEQTITSTIMLATSTPNPMIERISKKYELPLHTHEGNGIGNDWNFALSQVESKYCTLVHQDDLYEKEYGQRILEKFTKDPNALIGFSDYAEIKDDQVIPKTMNLKIKGMLLFPLRGFSQPKIVKKFSLGLGNSICCPAVTFNLEALSGFRFREDMKSNLDWYAWYELANRKGAFLYLPSVLMYHRIHEGSETSNAIENNIRSQEDYEMFCLFWPKSIAKLLMKFYVKSQETN